MTAPELNEKFGLSGIAEIVEGEGNLPKIRVTTSAATAEIYLHGAQVTCLLLSPWPFWRLG